VSFINEYTCIKLIYFTFRNIEDKMFDKHCHEETLKQYSTVIIKLVMSLLRGHTKVEDYTLHTNEELSFSLDDLRCPPELSKTPLGKLVHYVLKALWFSPWPAGRNPTMQFINLNAIMPSGSFMQPHHLTKNLAQISHAMKLCAIYEMVELVSSGHYENHDLAYEGQIRPWVHIKRECTFHEVNALQAYATKIVKSTPSLPNIVWLEKQRRTELLIDGKKVTLAQLSLISQNLEDEVVSSFKELLLGADIHLDLFNNTLADHMQNTNADYSWMSEPSNEIQQHTTKLLKVAFPEDCSKSPFVISEAPDELDRMACQKYISRVAKLEAKLMAYIHLTSGGPARQTEMISLRARNTRYRTRNYFVYGKETLIVRSYNKTTGITQKDKLIPMALSTVAAGVLAHLHILIRPLVGYLVSQLEPENTNVQELYYTLLFMDDRKEFGDGALTTALQTASEPVLLWGGLGVRLFRQIYAALNKYHDKETDLELDDLDQDDVGALQMGHTLETERMRYAISADALSGLQEDTMDLYVRKSHTWSGNLRIVRGGLGLGLEAGRHSHYSQLVSEHALQGSVLDESTVVKQTPTSSDLAPILSMLNEVVSQNRQQMLTMSNIQTDANARAANLEISLAKAHSKIDYLEVLLGNKYPHSGM
jgi:hypothetical protein